MLKIVSIVVAALALGIGAGLLVFWVMYMNVHEGFEPVNPAATTDEIRPSK